MLSITTRWSPWASFTPVILLQPLLISWVSVTGGDGDTAKDLLENISESIKKIPLYSSELCRQHSSASERNLEICISSLKAKYRCVSLPLHEPTKPQYRIGSNSWILALGKSELSYCSSASGFDSAWKGEKSRQNCEIPASNMLKPTSKLKVMSRPKSHTSTGYTGLKGIKMGLCVHSNKF